MPSKRDTPVHHRRMRRGSLRATLLLVLALAFLTQTISWAARVPARPAAQEVEICVAHGVAVIQLDADGAPVKPQTGGPAHDCPLCPLIAGLSIAPTWASAVLPPSSQIIVSAVFSEQIFVRSGATSDIWARGPPARRAV